MSDLLNEPELTRVAVADVTNAAINTLKNTNVLAISGAGLRYRIYAVSLAFDLGTGTPAAGAGILGQAGGSAGMYLGIEWTSQPAMTLLIPGGYPLSANSVFQFRTWPATAVVGGVPFVVSALYVLESV